ncbi:hypothetical protein ACJMK2_011112 [Sinanodonta woodiana]|uniref:Uncharacterized protein n=1 Tax=Sinanodonta woodiana TaxID=1069815 RepID=A0ABD3V6A2_SINWO
MGRGLSVSDQSEHRRHRHSSSGIEDTEVTDNHSHTLDSHCAVEIKDGRYSWDLKTRELTLKDINIKIPAEKLTMIVGPVGSGKTSLLSAMLGEMLTVSGSMEWSRNCRISYVAQRPWLLNTTLKENILFGQTYVWRRYKKVIDACALQPDIAMLPIGENTEIGEKGVNLSGGQKQRISIARALYFHSDTVLLDDPLSALDVHVGRHVFEEVILRKLLKRRKTVILVTHQLQYLNFAHHIIVMRDGEIQYQGKLVDVKKNDPDLYSSWRKALKEASIQETKHISQGDESGIDGKLLEDVDEEKEEDLNEESLPSGKLIRNEHREVGAVKMSVYLCYLKACGILLCIFVVLMLLLNQGLLMTTNFWLSIWSSASTEYYDNQQTNSTAAFDNSQYLHVYVILFAFAVASTLASGIILQFTGVQGARCLHDKLLTTILNVPIRFFETNPSGRIVNRFSSDVSQIDQKIPGTWDALLRCCLAVFSAIIVNSIGTPYFILAAIPLIILYYCLQVFFRASSRELQRLDSVTKSPIYSQFSETLNGLVTIRAYRAQTRFQNETLARIDSNVAPFLFNQTANRWLGIRLDYMGAVLVGIASIASLMSGVKGNTNPAFIGLCIAYALMVSNYLNWIVRNIAELEMLMNSTERVDEYTKLQREPQSSSNDNPDKDWPSQGEIHFKNVSLTYDTDLESVVMGVSFTIQPGEKIGVCGRTGSGKTSLTLALFRMIKITTGEVIIDGRDISSVPLSVLRSKLAIIPQDPVLFTGTIRHNLDPIGEIPDNKLWEALQTVELKDTIETLEGQLDASVSEGGENFSVGQKQLFCLARAFLRNNTILVLDEATASIDLETDNKLQHVVSNVFRDKTVITVAHRISTIMKYDRVMVMDMGKVVEFDTPQILMEDHCSHFYGLVHQTQSLNLLIVSNFPPNPHNKTSKPHYTILTSPDMASSPTTLSLQSQIQLPSPSTLSLQALIQLPSPTTLSLQPLIQLPSPTTLSLQSQIQLPSPTTLSLQALIQFPSPNTLSLQSLIQLPSPSTLTLQSLIQLPSPTTLTLQSLIQLPSPTTLSLQALTWLPATLHCPYKP